MSEKLPMLRPRGLSWFKLTPEEEEAALMVCGGCISWTYIEEDDAIKAGPTPNDTHAEWIRLNSEAKE